MPDITTIAEAVAAELDTYHAEVSFLPEFDLRDLDNAKVVVVPAATEYRAAGRGLREELHKISVGILKRTTEDELPDMTAFVSGVALGLLNRRFGGALCVSAAHDPLFSIDHLRERRQFTSVIVLTFKTVVRDEAENRL